MASKVHEVKSYHYLFDARSGTLASLRLYGDAGEVGIVEFVDDDAAVPSLTFTRDLNSAEIAFKRRHADEIIDMLRNESPVALTINDQPPGFVFLHTGREPAGEGEIGGS
jgi:hypothetical protein